MNDCFSGNYLAASDDLLLRMAQNGDDQAITAVLNRYTPLVRSRAAHFAVGADVDDMVQEGFIGLYGAIGVYDSEKSAFPTFARLCIDRMMITVIRAKGRKKNIPSDLVINIDSAELDTANHKLSCFEFQNPENICIATDEFERFKHDAGKTLSKMEYDVFRSVLFGESITQISRRFGLSLKSVDNALQRIRRKLR